MMKLNLESDCESLKSFEEKSDSFNTLDEFTETKFEDCFSKIFEQSKIIDIDSDNESIIFMNPKETISSNVINPIKNKEKENTIDQSKDKAKKQVNFNDLCSSISFQDNINILVNASSSSSDLDNFVNSCKVNSEQKKEKEIPSKEAKTEENLETNFLGKKRNLFKIDYLSTNYSVFNNGNFCEYSRQIIDEVMKNFSDNYSKNEDDSNSKPGNKRKSKKILNVQKRKENSDNIRKKIKSRFLKVLRNSVNERLKCAGSDKLFKFLPQQFIANVSKGKNKAVLNLSFKELFSTNFCEGQKIDDFNYHHNLSVINYLEANKEISEKSNFKKFKDMKFYEIYNEYLKSKEFEMEIASLKQEKETDNYIKNYIIKASDLIDFFSN